VKNPALYIVFRILAFALPLAVFLLLGFNPYFSAIVATALGTAVSILLLSRSREELSKNLYNKFNSESAAETAEDED
jgi:uncharacterized RDD family membrane protein YckC